MRIFLIAFPLLAVSGSQARAASLYPLDLEPKIESGVCTYHAELAFNQFPDHEIFINHMIPNSLKKVDPNFIRSRIEVVQNADTGASRYILHIERQSERVYPGPSCRPTKLQVLVR
mgnify:CR=1 FL=1